MKDFISTYLEKPKNTRHALHNITGYARTTPGPLKSMAGIVFPAREAEKSLKPKIKKEGLKA